MDVHIYIEISNKNIRKTEKRYAYILECTIRGEICTIGDTKNTEATYHGAVLEAAVEALKRVKPGSEVFVHAEDQYILNMFRNVPKWIENGFTTAKGTPIRNAEEWEQLAEYSIGKEIHGIPGHHSYTYVMQKELQKGAADV